MTPLEKIKMEHQDVVESLPWFANGTLSPNEMMFVKRHLANCTDCQLEYKQVLKMQRVIKEELTTVPSAEHGLNSVLQRIANETVADRDDVAKRNITIDVDITKPSNSPTNSLLHRASQWFAKLVQMPAQVALAAVAVLGFTVIMINNQQADVSTEDAPYSVLSSDNQQVDDLRIRVEFASEITIEEAQNLLQRTINLSTDTVDWSSLGKSVFTLSLSPTNDSGDSQVEYVAELLNKLQQNPQVVDSELLP